MSSKQRLGAMLWLTIALIAVEAQGTVVDFATGEYFPFTSETAPGYGIFTAIVSAACAEAGIVPRYSFVPWKRAEEMTRSGRCFACFPYVSTPERQKTFVFSEPIVKSAGVFFALRGGPVPETLSWKALSELRRFRIGGVLGYWYEPDFKAANLDVVYSNSDENNFILLMQGRVDMVPCADVVGWEIVKKTFEADVATKVFTVRQPLNDDELGLMVSRSYPDSARLLTAFNAGLAAIRKNGTYTAIMAKYSAR